MIAVSTSFRAVTLGHFDKGPMDTFRLITFLTPTTIISTQLNAHSKPVVLMNSLQS